MNGVEPLRRQAENPKLRARIVDEDVRVEEQRLGLWQRLSPNPGSGKLPHVAKRQPEDFSAPR